MHSRLLSQSRILGLTLGALVIAATLPARAESPQPQQQNISVISAEALEKPLALKKHTVSLAADDEGGKHRVNRPLMLTSSALLATGYLPALVTALANSKNTSGWLGVPVVGPWIDWGPHTSPGNKVLLFGSGLLQAAGLAGLVTSFFVPESKTKKMHLMGQRRFNMSPVAGRGTVALSATGRF